MKRMGFKVLSPRKITYPKKITARYKATFRSLLAEIRSTVRMNRRDRWTDDTLVHNIATIVCWRIIARDRKQADLVRKLRRAVNALS